MIPKRPFGNTGHDSSCVIFGAAAFAFMKQDRCDRVMETLLEFGVNHIDTAADYGESELRLRPWLHDHRDAFFVATKTGKRSAEGARESLHRSLDRLGVESIDLLQFHHLVDQSQWDEALGSGGAIEAAVEARDRGLVRFIGVTGHGTQVAKRHLQSLERFPFDSVLLPYNPSMMAQPEYSADFEQLVDVCQQRGVAVQTIKALAKRRWRTKEERKFSWYEPITDPAAIDVAVAWALQRKAFFLNSSSDVTLLRAMLEAACRERDAPSDDEIARWSRDQGVEALFEPGRYEEVGLA